MSRDFIVFGAPQIHDDEVAEVVDTLRSTWLGTGPKVARFEADFARYRSIEPSQVAAVNSGTAALHLSLLAVGIEPGQEVIVPAMTFCATMNAVIHAGGTPVLADVDPVTMTLDPDDVEARITPNTRAIVPVHFAGLPCDMDRIMAIAERHNLIVVEDCAHAIETRYKGQLVGSFGDMGCFSFYVTKNLATGEGGMVTGRNKALISRIRILALHGMSQDAWHRFSDAGYKHYSVVAAGFKYNMMDLQAAIGIHQLQRLDANHKRRQWLWHHYRRAFGALPASLPADVADDCVHACHLFPILISEARCGLGRDDFLDLMTDAGIGTGVHYNSLASHPYYQQRYGFRAEDYPHADRIGQETVSINLSAALTDAQVDRIVDTVWTLLGNSQRLQA